VVLTDEKAVIPEATQKIDLDREETRDKARRRLKKKLAGDLDMIVLMALRKEPSRRYASVEQFSGDIGRYLEGRPVIARSDTFGYRAGRFIRRNVAAVLAATVAVLTLFGATIFELRSAERAAQQDLVDEQHLQVLEAESLHQQSELMDAYFRLAESQTAAAALETYRRALDSARAFERTHPGNQMASGFIAHAAVKLGDLAPERALDLFTEARTRLEPVPELDPASYFAAFEGLGRAQLKNHDVLGALASFSRALQIAEAHANRRDLASSNFWVGTVLAYNGETEAGAAKLRKAFEIYRDLAGVRINSAEDSPAGYRKALADLAAQAPPDLRLVIESQLREST
jgi:hypothetical protein